MNTAVAHGNKDIVFAKFDARRINFLIPDIHLGSRIIKIFAASQQDHGRVVILNDFRFFVVHDPNDRKRRISDAAHRADRKRSGYRLHTVLDRKPF